MWHQPPRRVTSLGHNSRYVQGPSFCGAHLHIFKEKEIQPRRGALADEQSSHWDVALVSFPEDFCTPTQADWPDRP